MDGQAGRQKESRKRTRAREGKKEHDKIKTK